MFCEFYLPIVRRWRTLTIIFRGDEVRINSSDKALKAIRKEFRRLVPEGRSVVDEFLADKKAEAARE